MCDARDQRAHRRHRLAPAQLLFHLFAATDVARDRDHAAHTADHCSAKTDFEPDDGPVASACLPLQGEMFVDVEIANLFDGDVGAIRSDSRREGSAEIRARFLACVAEHFAEARVHVEDRAAFGVVNDDDVVDRIEDRAESLFTFEAEDHFFLQFDVASIEQRDHRFDRRLQAHQFGGRSRRQRLRQLSAAGADGERVTLDLHHRTQHHAMKDEINAEHEQHIDQHDRDRE